MTSSDLLVRSDHPEPGRTGWRAHRGGPEPWGRDGPHRLVRASPDPSIDRSRLAAFRADRLAAGGTRLLPRVRTGGSDPAARPIDRAARSATRAERRNRRAAQWPI